MTTALGPMCVATVANKMETWDVEIIDENNYQRYGPKDSNGKPDHETLQKIRPADVVGLYGGLTSTAPRLYQLAEFYKKLGIITIAGGQHFAGDNISEALNNHLDFVVIGEGEETIKELLKSIQNEQDACNVKGIAFLKDNKPFLTPSREPITDFDKLPAPDFSLVRYAKIRIYPVGWVRGCGMFCEFCTVKGKVRCPAPEYVFEQITALVEKFNAKYFFMVDDLFGQNRKAALRLCEMLTEYQDATRTRLDIMVQIRLDKAKDPELLQTMRQARITGVAIGFESPIAEELEAMNKKIKPEDMVKLSRIYHKAGFLVHGMFIFGYPMPDGVEFNMSIKERVKRFKQFIRKAKIDTIQVLLPVPLPGTELTERLKNSNRIFSKDLIGWEYYDGNFPLFQPDKPMTPEEIQKAIQKIMGVFYKFKSMFAVGLHVLSFPAMLFFLYNVKKGWRKWYRPWRNNIIRFGGWIILKNWTAEFKKGVFSKKLNQAKKLLKR
ncbi:B12-binding domain-containing radical SAM protein [Verrucomicrobiota bacterium]